jgi:hypothetical protein
LFGLLQYLKGLIGSNLHVTLNYAEFPESVQDHVIRTVVEEKLQDIKIQAT